MPKKRVNSASAHLSSWAFSELNRNVHRQLIYCFRSPDLFFGEPIVCSCLRIGYGPSQEILSAHAGSGACESLPSVRGMAHVGVQRANAKEDPSEILYTATVPKHDAKRAGQTAHAIANAEQASFSARERPGYHHFPTTSSFFQSPMSQPRSASERQVMRDGGGCRCFPTTNLLLCFIVKTSNDGLVLFLPNFRTA